MDEQSVVQTGGIVSSMNTGHYSVCLVFSLITMRVIGCRPRSMMFRQTRACKVIPLASFKYPVTGPIGVRRGPDQGTDFNKVKKPLCLSARISVHSCRFGLLNLLRSAERRITKDWHSKYEAEA